MSLTGWPLLFRFAEVSLFQPFQREFFSFIPKLVKWFLETPNFSLYFSYFRTLLFRFTFSVCLNWTCRGFQFSLRKGNNFGMQHVIHGIRLFHNYFVGVAWHLEIRDTWKQRSEGISFLLFAIINFCGLWLVGESQRRSTNIPRCLRLFQENMERRRRSSVLEGRRRYVVLYCSDAGMKHLDLLKAFLLLLMWQQETKRVETLKEWWQIWWKFHSHSSTHAQWMTYGCLLVSRGVWCQLPG